MHEVLLQTVIRDLQHPNSSTNTIQAYEHVKYKAKLKRFTFLKRTYPNRTRATRKFGGSSRYWKKS